MQKTCEGMLRNLLHSLLQFVAGCAIDGGFDLIKHACGSRWSSNNSRRSWSCEVLHEMLARLTSDSTTKFFVLIDALDECEPQDRPEKTAAEVLKISRLPNVKLCISCRPWESFTSRFPPTMTLFLDQLTHRDMELYVESRLIHASSSNHLCAEFRDKTTESQKFSSEVVRAAEGVFLWIELVLNELCSELRKGRELQQLRNTLAGFPVGLDRYFEQFVLDRIMKTSQSDIDTAATLKLALAIAESTSRDDESELKPSPDSFLNFWLLRGGHLKPGFSWKDHIGSWYSPEDVQLMVAKTRSFLEESCKDLLLMFDRRDHRVDPTYYSEMRWDVRFLHRTVTDFLHYGNINSIIQEHSPAHFTGKHFLGDLRKIRCSFLLHELQAGCRMAEEDFRSILQHRYLQPWNQGDINFVIVCEASMVQRFEEACGCVGTGHFHRNTVSACASTGLTRYVLAVLKIWPSLATCAPLGADALMNAVLEYLELDNSTIVSATSESLDLCSSFGSTMTTSLYRLPIQQNRFQHKHGLFSYFFPCAVTNPSFKLADHLLARGCDPNGTGSGFMGRCQKTLWEKFLSEACQKVHRCEQETDTSERPEELNGRLQDYKHKFGDLIALFLWHGANPKCTPCTSEHTGGYGPCERTSLQDILPNIVPQEKIATINEMQVIRSKDFDHCLSQRGQRSRAIRSWLQSEQSFVAHAVRRHHRDQSWTWLLQQAQFLHGLTGITGVRRCNKCLKNDYPCGGIWCVDCIGRYILCKECSDDIKPEISDGKVLEKYIVHEEIPSVKSHTSIAFGDYRDGIGPWRMFGIAESMSALKEWNARNSVEPDSGVD